MSNEEVELGVDMGPEEEEVIPQVRAKRNSVKPKFLKDFVVPTLSHGLPLVFPGYNPPLILCMHVACAISKVYCGEGLYRGKG
ncbi:hypothetical protein L195_g057091, partial [Trifolium pratense]